MNKHNNASSSLGGKFIKNLLTRLVRWSISSDKGFSFRLTNVTERSSDNNTQQKSLAIRKMYVRTLLNFG